MAYQRFTRTLLTKAVKVPARLCSSLLKSEAQWLLNRPRLKNIAPCDQDSRLLLLNENFNPIPESLAQYELQDFK
jgi:hypothetical protein